MKLTVIRSSSHCPVARSQRTTVVRVVLGLLQAGRKSFCGWSRNRTPGHRRRLVVVAIIQAVGVDDFRADHRDLGTLLIVKGSPGRVAHRLAAGE